MILLAPGAGKDDRAVPLRNGHDRFLNEQARCPHA